MPRRCNSVETQSRLSLRLSLRLPLRLSLRLSLSLSLRLSLRLSLATIIVAFYRQHTPLVRVSRFAHITTLANVWLPTVVKPLARSHPVSSLRVCTWIWWIRVGTLAGKTRGGVRRRVWNAKHVRIFLVFWTCIENNAQTFML